MRIPIAKQKAAMLPHCDFVRKTFPRKQFDKGMKANRGGCEQ